MGALDQALLLMMISDSVDLARLDAGERAKVLALLDKLGKDLAALLASNVLSEMGKASTKALLKEIAGLVADTYSEAAALTTETVAGLAELQANFTAQALETALSITLGQGATLPATFIETLASNILIDGSPAAKWWSRQAGDVVFRFSAEVRKGIAAGETNQQIIARIVGKGGEPGVMEIARKNAAALVQSSVQTVANEARLATFRKNADIINGVRWLSTLDSHTCEICGVRDGLTWDLDGKGLDSNDLPFEAPPIHFNCRCTLTAVLKPMSEISGGGLPDLPENGQRAASGGPVPASTTFEYWFKTRSASQQDEQFGKGKSELFREGKISMRDMLDQRGNPLTLAQLREKYGQ